MVQTMGTLQTKLHRIKLTTTLCCLVGMMLCTYSFYVEYRVEHDTSYQAMCDINEHISCTKAFSSRYGKGFGLLQLVIDESSVLIQPNSVYGLIFYFCVLTLGAGNFLLAMRLQLALCCLANLGSLYLGYILYFILQDACIICIATYVVNFLLVISSRLCVSVLKQLQAKTGRPIIGGPQSSKKRV